MADPKQIPQAAELIYLPEPSWAPLFAATGLTGLIVGLFTGWVWAAIGAVVFVLAVGRWIRSMVDEISRMPRTQRPATAVLPARVRRSE